MWFIGLVLSYLLHLAVGVNRTLLAVDLLFRHGDRTPINPYPTDPYKDPSEWPVGWGQLTPRGKMMHFKLGQYLRNRYGDLLPDDYSEKDIYVRSTNVDRTLMSALSDLAGLYPPTKRWKKDLDWQPIPVHTVALENDNILSDKARCPKLDKLVKETLASEEIHKYNQKYDWVYKHISNYSGDVVNNLRLAGWFSDTLFIENLYNKTLPEWTKKVFPEPLREMQQVSFRIDTWTHEMKRLRSGPFIKNLVDRMERIAEEVNKHETMSAHKMIMYSGHDSTVASLLDTLDSFDPPISPPYASCVMMELHRNKDSGKFEMRLLYRNQTDHEPFVLNYQNCGEFCPLEEFKKRAATVIPKDWNAECSLEMEDDAWIGVLLAVSMSFTFLLFVVLIISVIVALIRRFRRKRQEDYCRFQTDIN